MTTRASTATAVTIRAAAASATIRASGEARRTRVEPPCCAWAPTSRSGRVVAGRARAAASARARPALCGAASGRPSRAPRRERRGDTRAVASGARARTRAPRAPRQPMSRTVPRSRRRTPAAGAGAGRVRTWPHRLDALRPGASACRRTRARRGAAPSQGAPRARCEARCSRPLERAPRAAPHGRLCAAPLHGGCCARVLGSAGGRVLSAAVVGALMSNGAR
jgi:hypothetical protein